MKIRTNTCGQLRKENIGEEIVLNGWVENSRDHGGVRFIDLRDRFGLTQIKFNEDINKEAWEIAHKVRSQFVLSVTGTVISRGEAVNDKMLTGEIEVEISSIEILNECETPPFEITDYVNVNEELRLKYRYLDLRRPAMQENFLFRNKLVHSIREYFYQNDFIEVETPVLTKSTPEGARDYLVPSRVHSGEFYALPQSPQLFKQLLMVSGFDKYIQIVKCFRDEDLRADRQPEFTQIDIEMSFVDKDIILNMVEELVTAIFKETLNIEVSRPFQRIPFLEAMDKYGSDKPELRFGMQLINVSELMHNVDFKVFRSIVEEGGMVKVINAKGGASLTRKEIDNLEATAKTYGARGLAWIKINEDGLQSPIVKFFSEEQINAIVAKAGGEVGDLILFGAGKENVVHDSLGQVRLQVGKLMKLYDANDYHFSFVVDAPLFEKDSQTGRLNSVHHPFTMPLINDISELDTDIESVLSDSYDLVINGCEIGGGSIRIHKPDIQQKIFELLGIGKEEAEQKFGFLVDALSYGAPPHGGLAFGLDRLCMILLKLDSLRDCIAFPKTQKAACLMSEAPSKVDAEQLKELSLKIEQVKVKK
ncbi:MAG: aspartate--tRNA ligase [Planctomycetota bacterium]|nr:MAG: aspartate--tRNA ligase [Planctomycetota bacterium]